MSKSLHSIRSVVLVGVVVVLGFSVILTNTSQALSLSETTNEAVSKLSVVGSESQLSTPPVGPEAQTTFSAEDGRTQGSASGTNVAYRSNKIDVSTARDLYTAAGMTGVIGISLYVLSYLPQPVWTLRRTVNNQ